jgi:hypothetical protein
MYNPPNPTSQASPLELSASATVGVHDGEPWQLSTIEKEDGMKTTANQLLNKAATLMQQRGEQYDKPNGERSMAQAATAFNAITGLTISEADGYLLMALLKMVRDNQKESPHTDSIEDLIAYAALYGEARLGE